MVNVRELVLKALYRIAIDEAYSNQALKEILSHKEMDAKNRGFATELLVGVVRNQMKLDYIIAKFSKIKLKKLSPWVHQILRMGVYQIVCMDKVPESAACNESVKLARRYAHGAAQGYINGVLRNVAREKENFEYPVDPMERMSVVYSCPLWLTEKLVSQYGIDGCEKILKASHQKYPVSIRVNRLKTTPGELQEELNQEGILTEMDPDMPWRLWVTGALDIQKSKAYQNGKYTIQNMSSMAAVEALSPKPGDTVMDLCAAPGGKTTFAAEMMENKGKILAMDIHLHKTELIEKSAKRLGISIIETKAGDASVFMPEWEVRADRVLVDAPCSGIGVIHKKPDIKWRRKEEDILALCEIQKGILETASKYVKVNGVLVYSTCTILEEENQRQSAAFLERHPEFFMEREQLIFTHETGGSGFYIAKFIRKR